MNNKNKKRLKELAGIISEKTEIFKDVLNQKYIAFDFSQNQIKPYLNKLREILTQQEFVEFVRNKKLRDRGKYHLTVVSPGEFGKLENSGIDFNHINLPGGEPELLYLGRAIKGKNIAYYIIVNFPEGNKFRESLGLEPKDFHVTIAFRGGDVHEVPKDISTKIV